MDFYYSRTKAITHLVGIHFLQDNIGTGYSNPWDDFGYVVTFKAYLSHGSTLTYLGELKIVANGFENTSEYFTKSGKATEDNVKSYCINDALTPEKVVSLGTHIDYYEKIQKLLPAEDIEDYLATSCDAGYYFPNYDNYKFWPGVESALLRDGNAAEARIKKGYRVAMGNYSPEPIITISIETLGDTFEPITFNFNNSPSIDNTTTNLLIGPNGTGKSHILKHITELLTGITPGREVWPYFHKLIVIAYSPFESFYSEREVVELMTKAKEGREDLSTSKVKRLQKINKYSYVGFKNNNGTFNPEWPAEHSAISLLNILRYDNDNLWKERSKFATLVDTLKLSIKFDNLALQLKSGDTIELTGPIPEVVEREVNLKKGIFFLKNGSPLSLSSGQKIYSYMLPALVSEIESESMIIIDEPELYLHPSLEIGLIAMLRSLLQETNSYALIATHSALLAREVKSNGVKILKKHGLLTTASPPTIETYGESIDEILGEAFDEYQTSKPFQKEISKLITDCKEPHEAIALTSKLGDEAISYAVSTFSSNKIKLIIRDE